MIHVFIINSFAGRTSYSEQIREELERKENFEYLVFNSEYPGHEGVLAGMIYDLFPDDTIRFYACGGSGTIRNIMSGLPDFSRAQFAEYPCGATNDFLAVFGKKRELFHNLDHLIQGEVVEMDYIRTNTGVALNTVSAGFDVRMIHFLNNLSQLPFGLDRSSYSLATAFSFFGNTKMNCQIEIDGVNCDITEADFIMIGNGKIGGGMFHVAENNSPVDGYMDITIVPVVNHFTKLHIIFAMLRSDWKYLSKKCYVKRAKRVNLYPHDDFGFEGNFDGELQKSSHLEAWVVPGGVKFVVPSEINVREVLYES